MAQKNHILCEKKVACIVPTYNGFPMLKLLWQSLLKQSIPFDFFVVDSSSSDETQGFLISNNIDHIIIEPSSFNHGGTRQMMVDRNKDYDFYVFLTQDAYLENECSLENILSPFVDSAVGAVCARQMPHHDANLLARHARLFNYPDYSVVKSKSDAPIYGIKTPFMSNSFAAYRATALMDVKGFPDNIILGEDMYVAAKMLLNDWKIAYASNAICRHSHNYSLVEEFKRYFDQGVFQSREKWIGKAFGGAGGEGVRFVKSELAFLGIKRIFLWPASIFRNFLKLVAYKLGFFEKKIPVKIKIKLSMHKRFWG